MKIPGPVILIGFKGSGKTVVGRALAAKLGLEYSDTDAIIEGLHEILKDEPLNCREIYKKYGAEYFKKLEMEAVREAFESSYAVISLGGGTLMNMEESGAVLKKGIMVHLSVEKETLFSRIMKNGIPAFFDPTDPRNSFEKYYEDRTPVYRRHAEITVDNTDRPIDGVVNEIVAALKNKTGGGAVSMAS
ncbi:MAG: hypothetical protein HZB29_07995 [Nitrospinae bacterium]|nr:hypothetical protein [Nitrospinota bacterium]